MRIAVLDTYYEAFRKSFPLDSSNSYEKELERILKYGFATADFYSHGLRTLGHQAIDIISDWPELQQMWAGENGNPSDILAAQLTAFRPDCVFQQDLSVPVPKGKWLLAGQISCALPSRDLRVFDCLFTSFPFYVERFNRAGIKAVYLPLAFEPRMLSGDQPERDIDIAFVGGIGNSHWKAGTDLLEVIAAEFKERFSWYGYGIESVRLDSPLWGCYKGPAWGRDMYAIYRRSKIVINRHGEVAEGYANNLRMFEATGCGAMLVTEWTRNLGQFFNQWEAVAYSSPGDAVHKIRSALGQQELVSKIAAAGQARTLLDHGYLSRMQKVSDVLTELLGATNEREAYSERT